MESSKEEISLLLKSYALCIEELYFHYMKFECDCDDCKNEVHPPLDLFKMQMFMIADEIIDELQSKYADHIEGMRRVKR